MNLTHKTLLLTAGILGASVVNASTAGVNLTNDKVQGDVNLDMGSFGINAGATHDKDKDVTAAHVGLNIQDSDSSGPLQVGIGVRLNVVDTNVEDEDLGRDRDKLSIALGLGGWYRYTLQQANRVSIYGSLYYSPEVLSFSSNLNHMYTYEFRAEYMTMRIARAYIRYGNTVMVYEDNSRKEFNKGFSVGATVDF